MSFGTVNADVIGTSVAGSNIGAGNASIMKNRIINGAMVIDQRNAGASVTPADGQYTLDRWVAFQSASGKYSVQQNAGSVTAPVGFSNYLGVTSLSAYSVGSTDYNLIQQPIEGFNTADLMWGSSDAKPICLSFWVRSSLTGTFGGSLVNSSNNRSYPYSYTISSANTWEQKSITVAGDTSGTWVGATNGVGLKVNFGIGVGTTYSGTAGAWAGSQYFTATGATSVVGTSGATFYITGVQLEVGEQATGFQYENYQTSLANCQRYFYSNVMYSTTSNQYPFIGLGIVQGGNSTGNLETGIIYPVTMRVNPTITIPVVSNGYQAFNGSGSGIIINGSGASLYQNGSNCCSVRWNFGTASSYGSIVWGNTTGAGITASAEL